MARLDHVAFLVTDLETAIARYRALGLEVEEPAEFEAEDSRESYVETGPCRILLQQPRSARGPLGRAMVRSGPGFGHLALVVPDLGALLAGLAGSGWLATGSTFTNLARGGPAWLVRPGVRRVVEAIQGSDEAAPAAGALERITLVWDAFEPARRLLAPLGLAPEGSAVRTAVGGVELEVQVPGGSGRGFGHLTLRVGGREVLDRGPGS